MLVHFHGISSDIENDVTFCGACYDPNNATNPSYETWSTCENDGFPTSQSANNQALKTWTKTLNISNCILRWKWHELKPGANLTTQYELYLQGDRTLNLHGVSDDIALDVYTEFNTFGSYGE